MTTIKYAASGEQRKQLVNALSEILECESKYLRAPSYGYEVGSCIVNRAGDIDFPDDMTEEEIEAYYNTRDWIVGEDARKADLSEARAAVIDEMRRNRYQELTEQKAAVAEVDGDMDQLSQFTLKQL